MLLIGLTVQMDHNMSHQVRPALILFPHHTDLKRKGLERNSKVSENIIGSCDTIPENSASSHKCSECQRCFTQRKLLNRHIRTVHAEHNPNTCKVCYSAFYNLGDNLIVKFECDWG